MTQDELRAREAIRGLSFGRLDPAQHERILASLRQAARSSRKRLSPLAVGIGLAAGLAAAAVLFLGLSRGFGERGPSWEVLASSGYGADVPQRFSPGDTVTTCADCELTLRAGDSMVWVITPGTEATFPSRSLFARTLLGHVARGEVRITTGPGFAGNEIEMRTGEVQVSAVGTTFAVTCTAEGTCICVFEGTVEVGRLGDPARRVPGGKRLRFFKDQTDSGLEDLQDMDRMKLGMLRDQGLGELAPH